MRGALVIGYGSVLRTDDGVGWFAAERLAHDPRLDGAVVIAGQQLTPELALDVSRASLVVLVDGSHHEPAGTFSVAPVSGNAGSSSSHHLDAASLAALALELYGRCPEIVMVSVGMASVELGHGLSPEVEAILPGLLDVVAQIVAAGGLAGLPAPAGGEVRAADPPASGPQPTPSSASTRA